MQIDFNYCIIEQLDTIERTKKRDAQSIADMIFKATEHRMNGFIAKDFLNDMHYPLDGMTQKERDYCLMHDSVIEQNLNTITYDEHVRKIFEKTRSKLKKLMKQATPTK